MAVVKPNSTLLVNLGAYKLEVTIHGPPRRAHNPIVIIIPGITSSIKEWTAVTQSLSEWISVVNYERAGYGQSEAAPTEDSRTAEEIATELHILIRVAKITPPYIVVCHSYGGIIAREFVRLRNLAQFKGFVFVDANTGETPLTFPNPFVRALQVGINTLKVCYGDSHRLGESAWQALLEEEARPEHEAAAEREIAQYHASGESFRAKELSSDEQPELGRVPLMVLHADYAVDLNKIYLEGLRLGNGTEADRAGMQEFIKQANALEETMQRKLLKLSERSKFQHVAGSGHSIHMTTPESVVDAVTWILMQYRC
ncbi:hypothetical protein ACHAPJ_007786 [Fusarium lateritium]